MRIVEYAKAHPVASGFIAIVGLIIFVVIVRGSGGGSAQAVTTGPSDTEIAANTAIEVARLQSMGAIQAAQVGAGVQLNSDNKAAEVAMLQINAAKELGLNQINSEREVVASAIAGQTARTNAVIHSLPQLKKKNRDDVLKSLVTGEYGYSGPSVNQTAQTIGAVSGLAKTVGSFFSDARLKENILHIGYDAKGRDVYQFNYKGSKRVRQGYIAQSLVRNEPEQVHVAPNGFLKIAAYG